MMDTRIAVVEDNPDNRLLVEVLLEDLYTLWQFDNGPEALEAMAQDPPDLVLLDISLPGMDGVQVLERMRHSEELAGIPVIALTAHAMAGDRERFLAAGFDGYVTKPLLDETMLIDAIDRLLSNPLRKSA